MSTFDSTRTDSDESILSALRQLANQLDPLPERVTARALAAFSERMGHTGRAAHLTANAGPDRHGRRRTPGPGSARWCRASPRGGAPG